MKNRTLVFAVFLFISSIICNAQTYYKWEPGRLTLDNGSIQRTILFDEEKQTIRTSSISQNSDENFVLTPELGKENALDEYNSLEFSFLINGIKYTGQNQWEFIKQIPARDDKQGNGVTVSIQGTGLIKELEISLTYLLYPELPVIRKYITFKNKGDKDFKLESLDIERLLVTMDISYTNTYGNYARQLHMGQYIGDWYDPLVVVHDITHKRGLALGNEVPSVLKRTAYHDVYDMISIGFTHTEQEYPFRKWIKAGSTWTSPGVFIATFENSMDISDVVNGTVNDFMRKHMGIRLAEMKDKPIFVYNTWNPFRHNLNEKLINELATIAAECGIEEFILDDGWQRNYNPDPDHTGPTGDWIIDETKFPGGFSTTIDLIKAKGMKPGLWIAIGAAHSSAKIFQAHPEWFSKGIDGNFTDLNGNWDPELHTTCFSTDWNDYIKSKIVGLVQEYGLGYTKLDFAITTSAYMIDTQRSGCYASDHNNHKDHSESLLVNIQAAYDFFDELHQEAPDLFIDCTYETAGRLYLIDYSVIEHAEGDWLSNFEEPSPIVPLRIRNLAWNRTPVMPAGSCVIGNLALDSKDLEFDLLSTVGTFPIMLGDLRKIPKKDRETLKSWSTWLRTMQNRYNYMLYRQDLPGLGEPREGHWDGWARVNSDSKSGGIIGVFRQAAKESSRTVFVKWLDPNAKYVVLTAVDAKPVAKLTGNELETKGFTVFMDKQYQAKVFEIKKISE